MAELSAFAGADGESGHGSFAAGPPRLVTKAEFAEELGVAKSRVSQLVDMGLPVAPNGKVRRSDALAWYAETVDPVRRKGLNGRKGKSSREKLDAVKLDRETLALAKERGEIVDRASAEAAVFERARAERDAWLAWCHRTAPALATATGCDPAALFAALDGAVREQLAELASLPLDLLQDADE